MKQYYVTFLLTVIMSMVGAKASAYDVEATNADGVTIYYKWVDSNNKTELAVTYHGKTYYENQEDFYKGVINIPESVSYEGNTYPVTRIGQTAFYMCRFLTSVTIPSSVNRIGNSAFLGCSELTSIIIPQSVTKIGTQPFVNCTSVTSIQVEEGNPAYDSRNNCNAIIETATNTLISGCMNTVIPDDVEAITDNAFINIDNLTSVTIPNTVKSIGKMAFLGCTGLTSIHIPGSVATIGTMAFASCVNLAKLTLSEGVKEIEGGAFQNCETLGELTFPSTVTSIGNNLITTTINLKIIKVLFSEPLVIEYGTFDNASRITLCVPPGCKEKFEAATYWQDFKEIVEEDYPITFADDNVKTLCVANWDLNHDGELSIIEASVVTYIGEVFKGNETIKSFNELRYFTSLTDIVYNAFQGCSSLTTVTIPEKVTSIKSNAFNECSSLTSIIIPDGVTTIGHHAFQGCSSLTSINIPSGVTSIDSEAFDGCNSLQKVIVPDIASWCSITFADAAANPLHAAHHLYSDETTEITEIEFPEGLKVIKEYAFYNVSGLTAITLPSSVWTIGDAAFSGCDNLISVTAENETPVNISKDVFTNRANATLYVPYTAKSDYEATSYWCDFQKIVGVGEPVAMITFADNNVKKICVKKWDTDGDGELSMDEAAAVTSIGTAFKSNTNIKSFNELQYFTGLTSIETDAFNNCSNLTSIILPSGVTSIETDAFEYCSSLTSIDIPNGVTTIANWAFYKCTNLASITLPKSITTISNYAFRNCDNLKSMELHSYIGEWFSRVTTVEQVVIGSEVTSIDEKAFRGCSNLKTIQVEEGNTVYDSRDNCNAIIETETNTLWAGCPTTTIPNSVTAIGKYAFSACKGLTSIIIPASVTTIGEYAFDGCSDLISIQVEEGNSVYDSRNNCNAIIETATNKLLFGCSTTVIPDDITVIGMWAFDGCTALTSIDIPNSVTTIEGYAFYGCGGLTSVTIPNNITTIGSSAFSGCTNLVSIEFSDGITSIGSDAFKNTAWLNNQPDGVLYIGKLVYLYKGTMPENTAIEIKDGILYIAEKAFYQCANLTSITFPNGLMTIGNYAFKDCAALTSITIPNSIQDFGFWTFDGCNNLKELRMEALFPPSVSSYSFSNIENIVVYVPFGSKSIYEDIYAWNKFKEIIEFSADNALYAQQTTGYRGGATCLPVSMRSDADIMGIEFDVELPEGVALNAAALTDRKGVDHDVTISDVNHITISSAEKNVFNGNDGTVVNLSLYLNKDMTKTARYIIIKNIKLITAAMEEIVAPDFILKLLISKTYSGDADGDKAIDVNDVTSTINHILNKPVNNFIFEAADVDGDGTIDVNDVQGIIDRALGKE